MKKFILILLCLLGCGKNGQKQTKNDPNPLEDKYNTYLSLTLNTLDINGFISNDACDSLLWTSLYNTAGGNASLIRAEVQPGEWERNPNGECTSISRDMILGLLTYIWHARDLQMIEDLIDYGEEHGFKMNSQDETDGANIMTPDIISTMYEIRYRLGGSDSVARLFAQSWWVGGQRGFLAHLQVLHIFLRGLVTGSVSNGELSLLEEHATSNPNNALFNSVYHRFSDGNQINAISSLLNEKWFPNSTLPTDANYCEGVYLFQRDEGTSDWEPCTGNTTKPGIELEFSAAVVLGIVR